MGGTGQRSRFYYMRWLKWMIRCYGAAASLILLGLTGAPIPVVLQALLGALAIAWFWISWFVMASSMGVETGNDGIRVGLGYRPRRFIPWGQIATFRVLRPTIVSLSVYAERTSGGHVSTGLVQGRKIRWKNGTTRDIVTVLNAALDQAGPEQLAV